MNEDISRNPTANLTKTNSEPTQYGVHSDKFHRHISAGIFSSLPCSPQVNLPTK